MVPGRKDVQNSGVLEEGEDANMAGGEDEAGGWPGWAQRALGVLVASVLPSMHIRPPYRQAGSSSC